MNAGTPLGAVSGSALLRPTTRWVIASTLLALCVAYVAVWVLTGQDQSDAQPNALRIATDALTAIVAIALAALLVTRVRRQARWDELVLAVSFTVTATGSTVWRFVYPLLGQPLEQDPEVALVRTISATTLAVAAWLPARQIPRTWLTPALTIGVLAAITVGLLAVIAGHNAATASRSPWLGDDAVQWLHGVATVLLTVGAVGMWRKYLRSRDVLWWWLGLVSAVLALSRLQLAMSHEGVPDLAGSGDHLPLIALSIAFAAAVAELSRNWREQAEASAHLQAHRLATEVHDGLVQEILFIRRRALNEGASEGIVAATERAESRARELMETLEDFGPTTNVDVIRHAALDAGARFGVTVTLDLPGQEHLSADQKHVIVRTVSEGIANVARYASVPSAHVELRRTGTQTTVFVRDRGPGFDVKAVPLGFGLSSLARDAADVGGALTVRSRPGRPTTLEVTV